MPDEESGGVTARSGLTGCKQPIEGGKIIRHEGALVLPKRVD
jgi:hypothetical protein